jgi:hypothetical protein
VNNQTPSTNNQIITNDQIPISNHLDLLVIGNWNLFGAWDLVIGI